MISDINKILWADSVLKDIVFNNENIDVTIELYDNSEVILVCTKFISIKYIGQWDEACIKDVYVKDNSDLIAESINAVIVNNGLVNLISESSWYELDIELIDNVKIQFVCNNIDIRNI
jgi:hypothetical protein